MITIVEFGPDYPVSPQAIFYRPLRYFTLTIREGEDGLDQFISASFAIGNHIRFDLRTYRGHAEFTVTLYLPDEMDSSLSILEIVNRIISEMDIPAAAVAWRRGDEFKWGKIERRADDRLREQEAKILALKIAATRENRTASTTYIKSQVPKYTELSPQDRAPSASRPRELVWQQIVGNVFSHHKSKNSLFRQGLAERTKDGLTVTEKGLAYLNSVGFLPSS